MNVFRSVRRLCAILAALALAPGASVAGEEALERSTTSGPVTATVRLEPQHPVIGDVVQLTLTVWAESGIELLLPEFGEALDRFTIIDFVPVPQRIAEDGRLFAEQRYTLQPQLSGAASIPPILVEFVDRRPGKPPAPEGADAYELLTERLDFEVQSVVPAGAAQELKPVLGELGPLETAAGRRSRLTLAIGALLAAVAAPLAIRALLRWRRRARRRSAYDIALQRLQRLLAAGPPQAEGLDTFYVGLTDVIRRYIEDRFELRAPEYTTEEFLAAASGCPDLTLEHQQLLREFLRQADLVKFAHALPSTEEVEKSIDLARRFLADTRQDAPLIDESPARDRTHKKVPAHV